jgi:glyoxylase-like metal-dependent hydrolase (beta-lactamase superfamily II)
MAIGDVESVSGCPDAVTVDTGMYDAPAYGSVYVIDAERPAVVDSGIGADRGHVFDALETVGIDRDELAAIVLTHVHLDHAGGAGYLAEACPDATVYVNAAGADHLVDPTRLVEGTKRAVGEMWRYYAEPRPIPAHRIVEVTDGDRIDLGDRTLRAHHAPGHAHHQVVYEWPGADAVFTADAAGIYVPSIDRLEPTTPPPEFDLDRCLDDLDLIASLDPETLCYGHFGPAPTSDRLDRYADTLREWVADVRSLREAGRDRDAIVEELDEPELADVWGEEKARAEVALNVDGVLTSLERSE